MKTIKTKKSAGKAYVYCYKYLDNGRCCVVELSKERAIYEKEYKQEARGYTNVSDISEVELFEEVEEQVPDVVERYYFVAVFPDGSDKLYSRTELAVLEEGRKEHSELGCRCSEIKLLREEF